MALKISSSILQPSVTNNIHMVTTMRKHLLHVAISVIHALLAMVTNAVVFSMRYMLSQKKQPCIKHGC